MARHVDRFIRRVKRYRNGCIRIEEQYAKSRIRISDVELIYSSSFLSVNSQWESLLEQILFEAVCGQDNPKSGTRRFAKFSRRSVLENILLFPERGFLSISNIKRAEELTSLFITGGRPISAVSEPNRAFLQQAVQIRNAIAHDSNFSKRKFRDGVPGVTSLPPAKRTPGAFLRHEFRTAPSQRRYELYFMAYQTSAREIAAAW